MRTEFLSGTMERVWRQVADTVSHIVNVLNGTLTAHPKWFH